MQRAAAMSRTLPGPKPKLQRHCVHPPCPASSNAEQAVPPQAQALANSKLPQPDPVSRETVRGLFIEDWQKLYAPAGELDMAALKARLAAHTPGTRATEPSVQVTFLCVAAVADLSMTEGLAG